MKKDHSKRQRQPNMLNTNTKTLDLAYPNYSVLIHSSMKCWKTVSLKPSLGLSVEIRSWFSKLLCFNFEYVTMFSPASF